jgi:hypothetical protein
LAGPFNLCPLVSWQFTAEGKVRLLVHSAVEVCVIVCLRRHRWHLATRVRIYGRGP